LKIFLTALDDEKNYMTMSCQKQLGMTFQWMFKQ